MYLLSKQISPTPTVTLNSLNGRKLSEIRHTNTGFSTHCQMSQSSAVLKTNKTTLFTNTMVQLLQFPFVLHGRIFLIRKQESSQRLRFETHQHAHGHIRMSCWQFHMCDKRLNLFHIHFIRLRRAWAESKHQLQMCDGHLGSLHFPLPTYLSLIFLSVASIPALSPLAKYDCFSIIKFSTSSFSRSIPFLHYHTITHLLNWLFVRKLFWNKGIRLHQRWIQTPH